MKPVARVGQILSTGIFLFLSTLPKLQKDVVMIKSHRPNKMGRFRFLPGGALSGKSAEGDSRSKESRLPKNT
jgi:hypothetical protein